MKHQKKKVTEVEKSEKKTYIKRFLRKFTAGSFKPGKFSIDHTVLYVYLVIILLIVFIHRCGDGLLSGGCWIDVG